MDRKKVSIPHLHAKKQRGEPISMITAYDYPGALAVDEAGVDMILVGDSLGMVVLGYESTVPVTMDEMISHTAAVKRGTKYAHIVGDMPFMSYQADVKEAVRNAGRFLKEGGADSIKLEGGAEMAPTVKAIVDAGIAVMGHIGLTPQSASKLGGYRVQGKTRSGAHKLLEDALALQAAGAYGIVLETTPARVSEFVSKQLSIPTIGIGAGAGCDGQVLVFHDLLGYFDRFSPRHNKRYANIRPIIIDAVKQYVNEVSTRTFPTDENSFVIDDAEFVAFVAEAQATRAQHNGRQTEASELVGKVY
ncbi:MAG: 3-methyl-2-oxobutanoate hydroxymethyltransferase [Thermoflexales bacterium]|nr:3-methyl-2-oxobutanoate hydroxymethyltransferase [Thermoflexales bacterium]